MRWTIRPMTDPRHKIDVRRLLVKALAEEIWRRCGGNEVLNWMEAEWHVEGLLGQARPGETTAAVTAKNESAFRPVVEVRHLRRATSIKRPPRRVADRV